MAFSITVFGPFLLADSAPLGFSGVDLAPRGSACRGDPCCTLAPLAPSPSLGPCLDPCCSPAGALPSLLGACCCGDPAVSPAGVLSSSWGASRRGDPCPVSPEYKYYITIRVISQ